MQGGMLILLNISIVRQADRYRQSGKLGKVMHKLYTGCVNCTKHTDPFTCPEIAMKRDLAPLATDM